MMIWMFKKMDLKNGFMKSSKKTYFDKKKPMTN